MFDLLPVSVGLRDLFREVERSDVVGGKDDHFGPSHESVDANRADITGVTGVVSVVTHHEDVIFGHDLGGIVVVDGTVGECLVLNDVVDVELSIFDFDLVVFEAYNSLDEGWGLALQASVRMEDDDVAADRVGEVVDGLIDQQQISHLQGRNHRLRGDVEWADQKMD